MKPMMPSTARRVGAGLATVAVTALLALSGCDRRPTDPPAPTDPGRTTPLPSTEPAPSVPPTPPASAASQ
jgi:hypothetical protein